MELTDNISSELSLSNQQQTTFGSTLARNLSLAQTKPYDLNPRRSANPRYEDIKSSILAQGGLATPLTVTQRPGDSLYMVAAGGNTRWHILNELWTETSNPCFFEIPCLVVPWKSESHCLAAHLVENELRGEMTFIDKALALESLKSKLETEGDLPLSRNEFVRKLGLLGYPISKRQLIRLEYAANRLHPLIPIALSSGFGSSSIDMLRDVEKACKQRFIDYGNQDFEQVFFQILKNHDTEVLDLVSVQKNLLNRLANSTTQPLNPIKRKGEFAMLDEVENSTLENDDLIAKSTSLSSDAKSENIVTITKSAKHSDDYFIKSEKGLPDSDQKAHPSEDLQQPLLKTTVQKGKALTLLSDSYATDLASLPKLRTQAHSLASALASGCDVSSLNQWTHGYGFYLDLTDQPIQNEQQYNVFWLLVGLSEQHISTERMRLAHDMEFANLILAGEERKAYERIGTPASLANFSYFILLAPQFPDSLLNNLLELVRLCRHIRQTFRESDIWDCLTVEQSRLRDQVEAAGGFNND